MKKILAILLSLVIAFGSISASAITEDEYNDYPVILVPGFASTPYYMIDEETGEQVNVWRIGADEILDLVKKNIVELGISIYNMTRGDIQRLADTLGNAIVELFDPLSCNDDGSSKYDLIKYSATAAETQDSVLLEGNDFCRNEIETVDYLADEIGIGHENIFVFLCDFRMSSAECAAELDAYIQDVKNFTKKDKVNVYAVSHGGQVAGTYLSLYGEKGDVENAVLTVPALGGALLAYDVLAGQIEFDEELLLRFLQHGFVWEEDYNWLMQAKLLGFLDPLLNAVVPYIQEVMLNWGSMWDFVPAEYYEELKNELLDPVANADIIAESDRMHYDIMPNFAESFKKAEAAGTHISIVAGYGNPSLVGTQESSDAIISINASTGAKVAPFGERFADGYTQTVDTGLYQVSPGMDIDVSCGYLPYNTWLIEDYYHGMTYKEDYILDLCTKLLLTDDIKDITGDPDYPQFHASGNACEPVWAAFNNSVEGYVSSDDTALIVKNNSTKSNMTILSIRNNMGLQFDNLNFITLAPGESTEILFAGELPAVSIAKKEIVISYVLDNNITPIGERNLSFTVMNGDKAEYDSENPLTSKDDKTVFDSFLNGITDNILSSIGIKPFISIIVNICTSWIEAILGNIGIAF